MKLTRAYLFPICLIYSFLVLFLASCVSPGLETTHPPLAAFFEGDRLLQKHTEDVFGKTLHHRRVRIMVTLPSEAASNYELVRDLIHQGTDCLRINCAHDTPAEWSAMIEHVHLAEKQVRHPFDILPALKVRRFWVQTTVAG